MIKNRNIAFFAIIVLLFSFIFVSKERYLSVQAVIKNNLGYISSQLLEQYEKGDAEAKKKIIMECLNLSGYENWTENIEYINIKIYQSNIIPDDENMKELIVALNLSKDIAILCIFQEEKGSYKYFTTLENLLPIEEIKFINVPNEDYNFLVIYEILDERFGGFFYEKFLEIFLFEDGEFINILRETLHYEEIYNLKWLDINNDFMWIKNLIDNNINFIMDDNLKIYIEGTKREYQSNEKRSQIPPENAFKLTNSFKYNYIYTWNEEFKSFSLSGKIIDFDENIAIILKDTNFIIGYNNDIEKFKVLTKGGNILYINRY